MLCQKILRANEGQDDISTSDPWNPWNLVDSQLTWWIFQNLASSNIRTTRRGRISFMPCVWAELPLQPARMLSQKLARTGQFQRDCKEFTNITLWHQLLQPLSLTPVLKNQHCASILQPHAWSYLRMLDFLGSHFDYVGFFWTIATCRQLIQFAFLEFELSLTPVTVVR